MTCFFTEPLGKDLGENVDLRNVNEEPSILECDWRWWEGGENV